MKTLIVGAGEVGQALQEILKKTHETYIRDIEPIEISDIEVLHICYPDSVHFVEITKRYIDIYSPKLTMIHSSVRIGTTKQIGSDVVYSPIRGRHPQNGLKTEIPVYLKMIACENESKRQLALSYFKGTDLKISGLISCNPDELEFCKIISNVHMGLEIAWRQEVERMLVKFNINPDIYGGWELTYALGLQELGQNHLMRSRMNPAPIGGHCILPCTEILKEQYESKFLDLILESNEKAKQDQI